MLEKILPTLKQKDHKFEASLGNLTRPCLKNWKDLGYNSVVAYLLAQKRPWVQSSIQEKGGKKPTYFLHPSRDNVPFFKIQKNWFFIIVKFSTYNANNTSYLIISKVMWENRALPDWIASEYILLFPRRNGVTHIFPHSPIPPHLNLLSPKHQQFLKGFCWVNFYLGGAAVWNHTKEIPSHFNTLRLKHVFFVVAIIKKCLQINFYLDDYELGGIRKKFKKLKDNDCLLARCRFSLSTYTHGTKIVKCLLCCRSRSFCIMETQKLNVLYGVISCRKHLNISLHNWPFMEV